MYIRFKLDKEKDRVSAQLVESYRNEEGRPRQRVKEHIASIKGDEKESLFSQRRFWDRIGLYENRYNLDASKGEVLVKRPTQKDFEENEKKIDEILSRMLESFESIINGDVVPTESRGHGEKDV